MIVQQSTGNACGMMSDMRDAERARWREGRDWIAVARGVFNCITGMMNVRLMCQSVFAWGSFASRESGRRDCVGAAVGDFGTAGWEVFCPPVRVVGAKIYVRAANVILRASAVNGAIRKKYPQNMNKN